MSDYNELLDELLRWCDPAVLQVRLHDLCGVTLRDATVTDLRMVLEELEDEAFERAEAFAWEYGDLSPFEHGGSHQG